MATQSSFKRNAVVPTSELNQGFYQGLRQNQMPQIKFKSKRFIQQPGQPSGPSTSRSNFLNKVASSNNIMRKPLASQFTAPNDGEKLAPSGILLPNSKKHVLKIDSGINAPLT